MVFTALLFDADHQFVAQMRADVGELRPPKMVLHEETAYLRRQDCDISRDGQSAVGFYYEVSHWKSMKDGVHPDGAFLAMIEQPRQKQRK